jgi:hypothetical protein
MATTNFQTGYAGLYMGKTTQELVDLVIEHLGETNYNRYPLLRILNRLNAKQRQFAVTTRVLRGWALIPMRVDIAGYALPKMCLSDGLERARFYTDSTNYDDMEIRDIEYMDDHYPGWMATASGVPRIVVAGDWFGNVQKIHCYPPPDTSGTTYATGDDHGVAIGGTDLPSDTNNIAGLATGGSTTTLEDSESDFTTMGLVAGMAVVNIDSTPGAEAIGYILSVAAHTLTFDAVMTESGSFVAGDAYEIMVGEYGTVTDVTDEEHYFFTADVGVIGQLTVPAYNLRVEFRRYPVDLELNTLLFQRPEIPWAWHEALADGAAAEILAADTQRRNPSDVNLSRTLAGSFQGAILQAMSKPSVPINRPARMVPRIKR